MRHRAKPGNSWPWTLIKLGSVAGLFALFPLLIIPWTDEQNRLAMQAYEAAEQAAQEAYVKPFREAFAGGSRPAVLEQCSTAIDGAFGYVHPVQALAWADDRVDAYVYVSSPQYGLRRISCSADGLAHSRIDHPLPALIPVEQPASDPDAPNPWMRLAQRVAEADDDLRSIELLLRPDDGSLLQRQVRRTASGWQVESKPLDSPAFPLLSTSPTLLASTAESGDAPSPLPPVATAHAQRRWSSATTEAFEFLARELPEDAKARIVGLRFNDDEIRVAVAAPVAGLTAAYGDIHFDAWGAATNWLYPRDEPPGFGCLIGRPLEELRASFLARCAEKPGCKSRTHFSIADYSCSQNNGGHWQLHIQSAN